MSSDDDWPLALVYETQKKPAKDLRFCGAGLSVPVFDAEQRELVTTLVRGLFLYSVGDPATTDGGA